MTTILTEDTGTWIGLDLGIVNTQHKTDCDVFEPANSCLKKPCLAKKTGKHGKMTLVPGCLKFCFHLGASWSFRCRFLMPLHAHLDFD